MLVVRIIYALCIVALIGSWQACGRGGGKRGSGSRKSSATPTSKTFSPETVIETSKPQEFDTGSSGADTRLFFTATGSPVDGRYLNEYLMVVRAAAASSIKLRVEPTSNVSDAADQDAATSNSSVKLRESKNQHIKKFSPHANTKPLYELGQLSELNFGSQSPLKMVATSPAICSQRIFRMRQKESKEVVSKMARLAYDNGSATKRVRVWLDREVGDICRSGSPASLPRIALSFRDKDAGYFDRLTMEHLQGVAKHVEQSLGILTGAYGKLSDVDGNGGVDVVVTPEINRSHFYKFIHSKIDSFQINPFIKPQDLAAYDPEKNPTSNEGEILYLWAPDPAGAYREAQWPTCDTLSTNFAKGFLAGQIMTHLITKYHLIDRKGDSEELWMMQAMYMLAASYAGGNDYTSDFLSNYLSSYPQKVSVSGESLGADTIEQEPIGMRALFGWYLHAKHCGTVVTPCAKIKDYLDTEKAGQENVESVLGEEFKVALANFGLSVATHLTDNPAAIRTLWNSSSESFPGKPVELPTLAQVNSSDPTVSAVANNAATSTSWLTDPTLAGAFPSTDMLLFQPLLPDRDISLELAENSVTPIIVTGLVNETTEVFASLGANLNISFVPLGKRDTGLREIHHEKLSEYGSKDQRPINLTTLTSPTQSVASFNDATFLSLWGDTYSYPTQTYSEASEYVNSNLTVNEDRELWITGGIKNFEVLNGDNSKVAVGDTDAYNIEVRPCQKTGCSTNQQVIVQIYALDAPTRLKPMILATHTDRGTFRGAALPGLLQDVDPERSSELEASYATQKDYKYVPALCQHDGSNFNTCSIAGTSDKFFIDHTSFSSGYFGYHFDNYLMSGPYGAARFNNSTRTQPAGKKRDPYFSFSAEEINRQFLYFGFSIDVKPFLFDWFPASEGVIAGPTVSDLDESTIGSMYSIKVYIDGLASDPGTVPTYIIDACDTLEVTAALCAAPYTNRVAIGTQIRSFANNGVVKKRATCYQGTCSNLTELNALVAVGANTVAYLDSDQVIKYGTAGDTKKTLTYYAPSLPDFLATSRCRGGNTTYPGATIEQSVEKREECTFRATYETSENDIRRQLYLSAVTVGSASVNDDITKYSPAPVFPTTYKALWDYQSFTIDTNRIKGDYFYKDIATSPTLTRPRPMDYITSRAGEILGRNERFHAARFYMSSAGAPIQIIVGGRQKSEGPYLLRVRVKNFD